MAARNSLRELVGQLLIFGFDGTSMTESLGSMLRDIQPGGIILFARNIDTPKQTHALLKEAQKTVDRRLFLCVDMEGGTVDRLKDAVAPAPSVAEVAATGSRELFRQHGRVIGAEVCALGFNVDFAPVLDLRYEISMKVLGSRTVSSDAAATITYAREFLRGLKDSNVLGCGKHFPGLGEGNLDSHLSLPVIEKEWKALWNEDIVPYRTLARQLPFVMVAHCAYPAVTKDLTPASISRKWIIDVLRKKIGYSGLVVSDDLEMGGVLTALPIEKAAIETIRAGADLFLVCHKEENVRKSFEAVVREAERSVRFRGQVEAAAKRVLAFKKRSPIMKRRAVPAPSEASVNKLHQKLWELSEEVRLATDAAAASAV